MSSSDVVAEEYASSLSDLVANSKPLINMLTMLAEENIDHAPAIVQAVERHLQQVRSDIKLPVLYLIDSIVKNVGQQYTGLFTQNIVSTFCSVFEKVDEKTRSQMFKLRQTWTEVFPPKKLYAMDVRVNSIDPAWPITAPVPTSIHFNPKFFPKQGNPPATIMHNVPPLSNSTTVVASAAAAAAAAAANAVEDPQAIAEAKMREQLLKKQKKLLELQQKKLELELLQTKAKLEEQQKQLERQTDHLHVQQLLLPTMQNVGQDAASKIFGTPMLDVGGPSVGVKPHVASTMVTTQVPVSHRGVATSTVSPVPAPSMTARVRSPNKMKSEVSLSKAAKASEKAAGGPGGRPRDPRLAIRHTPVTAQTNVVENVVSGSLQQPTPQQVPTQDSTNSVFDTVKLETAKPKPQITINIANKGNNNKEPQGLSKKDPRLNSNKVHVSNSKARSESSKSGGPKGPNKLSQALTPSQGSQSPSRPAKQVPLPRKTPGKGNTASSESSLKSASLIDLTDSPPYKVAEKKDEECSGKDTPMESITKSSSSSSSGSSSSSSPAKKDAHKSKLSSSRQSPLDKKKGSGKVAKAGAVGVPSRRVKSPVGIVSRRSRDRERDRERPTNKKFDMFETEADSPSPPPPPVISDNKKREDTTFKDVKVSKKGRNYVRRNRRDESRSPESSTGGPGDVDLRLGAPPEKHPRMNTFQADTSGSSAEEDSKKTLVDPATKDVDLRPLSRSPNKKRSSMERSDQPPNKKSKAEMIDVLFGNEDVDLRQLAPISVVTQQGMPPSPPPPPIISQPSPTQPPGSQESSAGTASPKTEPDKEGTSETSTEGQDENHHVTENGQGKTFRGWDKYKKARPDIYKSPFRAHKTEPGLKSGSPNPEALFGNSRERQAGHFNRHIGEHLETDGLGRPLLYHRFHENASLERRHRLGPTSMSSPIGEDTDMRTHLLDPDALEDVDVNINIIMQQADEQLKNGTMSFAQYNTLVKQVIHLNEMQKLKEAKRRDQQENRDSWERSRGRRCGEMGKASPRSEDENSRDSLPGGRFGDIDERFPVIKLRGQGSVPSPPEPQWNMNAPPPPHHGRPGVWEQPPPPWARGLGPIPGPGPGPGPRFPQMMHGGPPFHPPGPNNFGAIGRWRPNQFGRFEGEMDGRFDQFNIRFPRGGMPQPPPPGQVPPPQAQMPPQPQPQMQLQQQIQLQPQPQPPPQPQLPLLPPTPQQLASGELPLADALILEAIAQDTMRTINIDSIPREIRFYGDTAVVMLSWDDPRDIGFQGGTRRIFFDDRETVLCGFNEPYREFVLDGCTHRIRLGAPTRELYIDGKWYECFFGGPPVSVEIGGKKRLVKLEGPPPQVKIGMIKRTELVAGKINLIINARTMVPVFLDAKPQRFDIEDKPHVIKFTHALTSVVINGRTFKVEFGGLPMPIVVRGKKHFIRFSVIPRGIMPGYVTIVNMEGGRMPSPSGIEGENGETFPEETDESKLRRMTEPALPMLGRQQGRPQRRFGPGQESPSDLDQARSSPAGLHTDNAQKRPRPMPQSQLPLEMLTSLMPVAMAPSSGYSYQVEQESQDGRPVGDTALAGAAGTVVPSAAGLEAPVVEATAVNAVATPAVTAPVPAQATPAAIGVAGIPFLLPEINVEELFRKLVATGIVPTTSTPADEAKKKKEEDTETIKFVDFSQPETLKARQPALVTALYSGIQCSSCGVRFAPEQTMKYSQHLDWHFRQNRRDRDNTRKAQSRKWYYDISDWIQFEEIEDLEERAQSWFETQQAAEGSAEEKESVEVPSVPAGDSSEDTMCDVCHDKFEQFYNEETEEWHLRKAIRVEGKTYHPLCYEDLKANLERSMEESANADETKVGENGDGQATEEGKEAEEGDKAKEEGEPKAEEMETTPPADSTVDEPQGKKEANASEGEDAIKKEIKEEAKGEESEPMQVAECDSTVAKTEDVKTENIKTEESHSGAEEECSMPAIPKVDTTHTEVACSIDGNVKFEDKPQTSVAGPLSGKIKINITKALPAATRDQPSSEADAESSAAEGDADDAEVAAPTPMEATEAKEIIPKEPPPEQETPEPPPPGIEPVQLKPRLMGRKLTEMPPIMKGSELSGLCSIM